MTGSLLGGLLGVLVAELIIAVMLLAGFEFSALVASFPVGFVCGYNGARLGAGLWS